MKLAVRNTTLFISLSLVIIFFAGCSATSSAGKFDAANNTNLPKSEYPAAPVPIMEAQLTKIDGTNFKLADYKGKVLLVNLWATWCGPCKAEMPEFVKLQAANQEKGFEVIGLNVEEDETADILKEFGEKMGINYPLVKGEVSLAREFLKISKVDAIPQSFLIDRNGKLVGVFVGGGKNVEKIKDSVGKIMNS
jgi:thiol-disulfide isomerase/thioredoxin